MVHGTSYTGNRTTGSSAIDDNVIGDYRPGSIQRVKLQNFLTHGNVEFKPGPRCVYTNVEQLILKVKSCRA